MNMSDTSHLHGDRWDGVFNHEWHIERPSKAVFEEALTRLDARTYTMLVIRHDHGQHLTIGGGGGRYVVYATFDNEEFWNLLGSEPAGGIIMLNAGGQECDFPAQQIVGVAQARSAGYAFLDGCHLDPGQKWQKQ